MSFSHLIGNGSLVAHAFNKDCTEMAISLNTQDVYVLSVPQGANQKFQILQVLKDHNSLVTGIDWAPKSDSIVTCSADRTAYVWVRQADRKWKPTLVMLKLNRAVTSIRWSPDENKFAAGSCAKVLAIANFEKEFDLWNAKPIKKPIRSTVTCVDWHPNNALVACGSTDFKVRIYSAFIEKAELNPPAATTWKGSTNFGTLVFEAYSGNGDWVHGVAFSKNGERLAWVTHSSSVFVADSSAGDGNPVVHCLRSNCLPFTCCLWIADSTILVAGHDCAPYTVLLQGGELKMGKMLPQKSDKSDAGGKLTAMKKFIEIDRTASADNTGTKLATIHQNTIKEMRLVKSAGSKAQIVSSIGLDGLLVFWHLDTLADQMSELVIR